MAAEIGFIDTYNLIYQYNRVPDPDTFFSEEEKQQFKTSEKYAKSNVVSKTIQKIFALILLPINFILAILSIKVNLSWTSLLLTIGAFFVLTHFGLFRFLLPMSAQDFLYSIFGIYAFEDQNTAFIILTVFILFVFFRRHFPGTMATWSENRLFYKLAILTKSNLGYTFQWSYEDDGENDYFQELMKYSYYNTGKGVEDNATSASIITEGNNGNDIQISTISYTGLEGAVFVNDYRDTARGRYLLETECIREYEEWEENEFRRKFKKYRISEEDVARLQNITKLPLLRTTKNYNETLVNSYSKLI
jgi:hypothetical protein